MLCQVVVIEGIKEDVGKVYISDYKHFLDFLGIFANLLKFAPLISIKFVISIIVIEVIIVKG